MGPRHVASAQKSQHNYRAKALRAVGRRVGQVEPLAPAFHLSPMRAAIQPADRFSSSSSAAALECSFDMAETMLTLMADCGLGAELCFAACSMSVARFGSFRVVAAAVRSSIRKMSPT
jgi:hypothetical protein